MLRSAVVAVLVIVGIACGRGENQSSGSNTSVTAVASQRVKVSGATVRYRDIGALTWASTWIVQGRVAEVHPPQRFPAASGPLGTNTPQEFLDTWIYTDYVIAVDSVFRGIPRATITVRQEGGFVGSVSVENSDSPKLAIGDEWVVFLTPPSWDQPGDALWATGAAQGYWRVTDDKVAPAIGVFPTLPRVEFVQAIADALRGGPPSDAPRIVPLDQAPAGLDLPSPTTPAP